MSKMGRPRKELNWDEFDKLCHMHCTAQEIADWFGFSVDTLERRVNEEHGVTFAELYNEKKSTGKISLRRAGWQMATSGKNPAIWIFHAKNHLGMNDKQDVVVQNINKSQDNDAIINEAIEVLKRAGEGRDGANS